MGLTKAQKYNRNLDKIFDHAKKVNYGNKTFTVWVGGGEINDHLLTYHEAQDMAKMFLDLGYKDTQIENTGTGEVVKVEKVEPTKQEIIADLEVAYDILESEPENALHCIKKAIKYLKGD